MRTFEENFFGDLVVNLSGFCSDFLECRALVVPGQEFVLVLAGFPGQFWANSLHCTIARRAVAAILTRTTYHECHSEAIYTHAVRACCRWTAKDDEVDSVAFAANGAHAGDIVLHIASLLLLFLVRF